MIDLKKKKQVKKKRTNYNTKISNKQSSKTLFVVSFVFLILLVAILFLYFSGTLSGKAFLQECEDEACLIDKANLCEETKFTTKIGTSTIEMEVLSGCRLKKTILKLDDAEPKEIREFFEGKYMICDYDKGDFDDDFAYQITGPLDECYGPLVQAISDVI